MLQFETTQYIPLIQDILHTGGQKSSRAGDTLSLFGKSVVFDTKEFPILQGRKMFYRGVAGELAAMLKGPTCVEDFKKEGCNYWDKWADADGNLWLDYGNLWLNFNGVNQLKDLVEKLKYNPNDRRMLITGWDPSNVNVLSLPCCHLLYQFYVRNNDTVDMVWYQRSTDVMVGLPSDAIFAYLFLKLIAQTVDMASGRVTMMLGDSHIYTNHLANTLLYVQQFNEMSKAQQRPEYNAFAPKPRLILDEAATVFNFTSSMCSLVNYDSQKALNFDLNG